MRLPPAIACALAFAVAPAAFAQAKPADKKDKEDGKPSLAVEAAFLDDNVQLSLTGKGDLPDGALIVIRADRMEKGRKVPNTNWEMFAEARGGAFDTMWVCVRSQFRPGVYGFEATLRENQREGVAQMLTKQQKTFRATATLETGADRPRAELILELTRPIVTAFRGASEGSLEYAKHVASASEGKLQAAAWGAWKRKAGLAQAGPELEKTMARKDLAYHLPSSAKLASLAARIVAALGACDAAAGGKAADPEVKKSLEGAMLPTDDEVTRALRPLYLEGLNHYAAAADEIIAMYAPPTVPQKLAQGKPLVDLYVKNFPAFKALPWKGTYPPQFALLDDIFNDIKVLPMAKPKPADGKDEGAKAGGKAGGAEPLEAVVSRLRNTLGTFRSWLETEKQKP